MRLLDEDRGDRESMFAFGDTVGVVVWQAIERDRFGCHNGLCRHFYLLGGLFVVVWKIFTGAKRYWSGYDQHIIFILGE